MNRLGQMKPNNQGIYGNVEFRSSIQPTNAMTDSSGNILNKYAYDAYGRVISQTQTISNPFKYVGRFGVMDDGSGLLYMRVRYYDYAIGRFINKDPIGLAGGDINLYAYVANNPVIFIDPYGLWKGIWPGAGPYWHHYRNDYQTNNPAREPGPGDNWYYEGRSPMHGGYKSYRGTGPNKGFQCVYDDKGNRVVDPEFEGTYDYFPPYFDNGIPNPFTFQFHIYIDVFFWVLFGN